MQIDPRLSMLINYLLIVTTGIAGGVVKFTSLVPDATNAKIVGWAAVAAFAMASLNVVLHGTSSAQAGTGIWPWSPSSPPPSVPPVVGKMALLLAGALLGLALVFGAPSQAQARPVHVAKHAKAGPTKITTPDQIIAKVLAWATADGDADLAAAITLAKAGNNNVTLPCWTALQSFVKQVETLPPPASLPKLHLATDVELATDLMIALQPNSPVVAQCQALANYQKMSAVNMVAGIVTGALAIGKLPVPLPIP